MPIVFVNQRGNIHLLLPVFLKKNVYYFKSLVLLDECIKRKNVVGWKLTISLIVPEKNTKKLMKAYAPLFFLIPIHHCELILQIYQDWKFSHRKIFL